MQKLSDSRAAQEAYGPSSCSDRYRTLLFKLRHETTAAAINHDCRAVEISCSLADDKLD